MRLRTYLIAGVAAASVVCLGLLTTNPSAAQKGQQRAGSRDLAADPVIGRYHGSVDQGVLWLFDTMTGRCWQAVPGKPWSPAVGPVYK